MYVELEGSYRVAVLRNFLLLFSNFSLSITVNLLRDTSFLSLSSSKREGASNSRIHTVIIPSSIIYFSVSTHLFTKQEETLCLWIQFNLQ